MGKLIKITEKQERLLLGSLLKEQTFPVNPSKVLLVKNYLDKNFAKASIGDGKGADGLPATKPIVQCKVNGVADEKSGETARYVFDCLEYAFPNIFADKEQRTRFFKRVIQDWYYNRITKDGLLSTTNY